MYIYAFSDSNKEIVREIKGKTYPLIEHLIKIFAFPNAVEQNHWKKEVRNFWYHSKKNKRNKYPSKEFLMRNSWYIYEDTIFDSLDGIIQEYSRYEPISFDYRDMYSALEDYFKWITDLLSCGTYIQTSMVSSKIEELRNEYFN